MSKAKTEDGLDPTRWRALFVIALNRNQRLLARAPADHRGVVLRIVAEKLPARYISVISYRRDE